MRYGLKTDGTQTEWNIQQTRRQKKNVLNVPNTEYRMPTNSNYSNITIAQRENIVFRVWLTEILALPLLALNFLTKW